MNIIPHIGLSLIPFGLTETQVIALFGFPNKSQVTESGDREIQYFQHKIELKFEAENEDRLGWIVVHNKDFQIFDTSPWVLTKDEVIELFTRELDETPNFEDYFSLESYSFDNNWVELQFEFGELHSINIGVLYDEDDSPLWPGQA